MTDSLPDVGFGTYTLTDREECVDAVTTDFETGYRHVDTAQVYDNERFVGEAIDASPVPREDVTVATKLHWERLDYDALLESAAESRERLGIDVIDLLYVHWPIETYDPSETLPALDDLVDRGVVDRIGFCNCSPEQLDEDDVARVDGVEDRRRIVGGWPGAHWNRNGGSQQKD